MPNFKIEKRTKKTHPHAFIASDPDVLYAVVDSEGRSISYQRTKAKAKAFVKQAMMKYPYG